MNENGRALLETVVSGNFVLRDNKLISDYLFYKHGIAAVDLTYGNNNVIYERGLLIRNKINIELNDACKELNI